MLRAGHSLPFFLLACLLGCGTETKEFSAPTAPRTSKVGVKQPKRQDVENVLRLTGVVAASAVVEVRPVQPGWLVGVRSYTNGQSRDFSEGSYVQQGDLLFVVSRDLEFLAPWVAAEGARRLAEQRMPRAGTGSAASRAAETQALQAAETELERLRSKLNVIEIRAPITGMIGRRLVDVGNLVSGPDTLLTTIVATQPIHVLMELDESNWLPLLQRHLDSTATRDILLHVGANRVQTARLDYVGPVLNSATGMAEARAVLSNSEAILHPGMSVGVELALEPLRNALLVDRRAIQSDAEGKYLLIVNEQSKLERRPVETGPLVGELQVVRSTKLGTDQEFGVKDQYVYFSSGSLRAGDIVQSVATEKE